MDTSPRHILSLVVGIALVLVATGDALLAAGPPSGVPASGPPGGPLAYAHVFRYADAWTLDASRSKNVTSLWVDAYSNIFCFTLTGAPVNVSATSSVEDTWIAAWLAGDLGFPYQCPSGTTSAVTTSGGDFYVLWH